MVNIRKKKVELCWVNQFATPPNSPGGCRHIELAKALYPLGYTTTIVSSPDNYMTKSISKDQSQIKPDNFSFIQIPVGWRGPRNIGKFLKMVSFGNKVQRRNWAPGGYKPDVVIGSSPSLHGAIAASNLAKHYQVPFIFEVRDIWPLSLVEIIGLSNSHPLVRYLSKIEKKIVSRASRIITLLPNIYEHYAKLGIQEKLIDWVPNGIDIKMFPDLPPTDNADKTVVMYTGAHGPPNGLHTIVDAAKIVQSKNPSINFRFIGDGSTKLHLQKYAAEQGISNTTFEPAIPRDGVPRLLASADILVANILGHDLYRFGVSLNKLYEYLASSKPIALSSSAAGDPVTMAGVGPVVPADDSPKLAGRILEIAAMTKEERNALGLKGRKFVKENNTFDKLANCIDSCVQKALN